MYPPEFTYKRASTVDEAVRLLSENADRETELLAGGHSLLPTMKTGLASPDLVIDIGDITELSGISSNGESTRIGAMTTYAEIEASDEVHRASPVIAEAASHVGDLQVRNAGTIGGNIAHADPASDLPASILVADATIHVAGPDATRSIAAENFFTGMFDTAINGDELLTAIDVPNASHTSADTYVKKPSPSSGYAQVGVAARVSMADDRIEEARVAVNGALDRAIRLSNVEASLTGEVLRDDTIEAATAAVSSDLSGFTILEDNQVSSEFREQLVRVYTKRALEDVKHELA